MRKILKIVLPVFLTISMLLSITSIAWAKVSDVKGHWAEPQINDWIGMGLIKGYSDGTFKPENPISRAEFCALVNRSFGFVRKANTAFKDVFAKDWFADDISKAVAQGYLTGFPDKTAGPNKNITRQEVVTILARILKLKTNNSAKTKYSDDSKLAAWGRGGVAAVSELGYVNTYPDNTFRPDNAALRSAVVYILSKAVGALYNTTGTYGPDTGTNEVAGNVTISRPGITLKNMVIRGNLFLSEGIGEGSITLENVKVLGTTTICGGGEHGIILVGSSLGNINEPEKGKVRLFEKVIQSSTTTTAAITASTGDSTPSGGGGGGGGGGENPAPITVTSAGKLPDINVSFGTTIGAITLPAPVSVILNLSNLTTCSAVGISWDTSGYKPNVAGTYLMTGTIAPPNGVTNPSGFKANVNIVVAPAPITVTSVVTPASIQVTLGTTFSAITLPSVTLNLSNSTTRSAVVTWNPSGYNPNVAGTYTLSGTIIMPAGVTNPGNLTANVNIVVGSGVTIYPVAEKNAVKGTPISEVRLPTGVAIQLPDGTLGVAGVNWDTSAYNANTLGTYTLTGSLIMPAGVENPENTTASMKVNVVQPVSDPRPDTPAITSAGTLIDEYDSLTSDISSVGGTLEIDTRNKVSGAASVNITSDITTGGGIIYLHTYVNRNLSDLKNLQACFYVPDLSQLTNVSIRAYTSDTSYFSSYVGTWRLVNGWNRITHAADDFAKTNNPSWDNITRITIMFVVKDGCKPSVNVDRIAYNVQAKAKVLFTFDDGWYDLIDSNIQDNAFSYMTSKGFKGTVWANQATSGSSNIQKENGVPMYLNEAQLDSLYNVGWDIGNHTVNAYTNPNALSDDVIRDDYLLNQNWILDKNWTRGAHFVAYPSGVYSERVIEIMKGVGVLAARTAMYGLQSIPVDNIYKLKCIGFDQEKGVTQVRLEIDDAMRTGTSVIFMIHRVLPAQGHLAMSTADFKAIVDYVDQNRSSIDVVTMSEWYNAYVGATVQTVNPLSNISVAYGTTVGALNLPTQVGVTLNDNRTVMVGVNWNTLPYNPNASGSYDLTGSLMLPAGIQDSSGAHATIKVIVGMQPARTITGVDPIPDRNVAYGTTRGAIGLPDTVGVTLSDTTKATLGVTWDNASPAYNPTSTGNYTFTGTLTTTSAIINTSGLTASVRVIVGAQPVRTITGVLPNADIPVAYGTTLGAISLPTQVQVNLSNSTTAVIGVTWNTSGYNPTPAGIHIFSGTLTTQAGITNPDNFTASVRVVVAAQVIRITAVEDLEDIPVPFGTTEVSLKYLPKQVNVTLSNGETQLLDVHWNSEVCDTDVPGTYPLTGTLTLLGVITNPEDWKALVNVIVNRLPIP